MKSDINTELIRSTVLVAALAGSFALATFSQGQAQSGVSADPASAGGGGVGAEDARAKAAALAKATLNPIASLISLPLQNNFDWEREQWSVPVNAFVQQLLKVGKQPISLQVGGRYYADGPKNGPEWGLRFQVPMLFPK